MPNPVRKALRKLIPSQKQPRNNHHCHAETEGTRGNTDSGNANFKPRDKRTIYNEEQPPKRVNTSASWKHLYSNRPRSEIEPTSPSPERAVTFVSAEQASDEAQPSSDPTSNKPSPRTTRSSSTWSSVLSNSGSSIKAGLKKLNCIPPIFAHYPGRNSSQHSEKHHHSISRSRTDPTTLRKTPLTHFSLESSASGTINEIHPRPIPRPFTFPKTGMTSSGRNLQSIQTRLRARKETSTIFNRIWEEKALPRLVNTMDESYGRDYIITVQFDYNHSRRIVEIMTEVKLPDNVGEMIEDEVLPIFREPSNPLSVGFHFTEGKVERCAETSTDPEVMKDDGWDFPANTSVHSTLMLGDSVGYNGGDSAATLGPGIMLNDRLGFIVSRHLFDNIPDYDAENRPEFHLVHPAEIDCPKGRQSRRIAQLYIHSGQAYKTQQTSRSLAWFTDNQILTQAVTDWAVCIAAEDTLAMKNCLRYAPKGIEFEDSSDMIPGLSMTKPQLRLICSTGRSSGLRYGVVCETPAVVKHMSSGQRSREWYVENALGLMSTEDWNSGGIGLPGDSGAVVVDVEDQRLIGQVWGRNVYSGNPGVQRITYFTHFMDIFDDISRHPSSLGYPVLMDQRDERRPGAPPIVNLQDGDNRGSAEAEVDGTTLSSSRRSRAQSSATDELTVARSASNGSLAYYTKGGTEVDSVMNAGFSISEKSIGISAALLKPRRNVSIIQ
ncbi:zinc finger protein 585a [Colletotrichum truncatum]|uniref:Zinc finger protein 585a n=1 Tax=Colletotrichum truncatum TaxID=5467 RepID=A0ACC3YY72_COLTU|nr:zinc finger protein 585a [Colletotrichum truncatum]KAF6790821.1 zinc finger protein 585a [Colletotrichum truncatum]